MLPRVCCWSGLLVVILLTVCPARSQQQNKDCIPGLTAFNKTKHIVLSPTSCNQVISASYLAEAPQLTYARGRTNESYLVMLLEFLPRSSETFLLHWLLTDVKFSNSWLVTTTGVRDLASGYYRPVNGTQYELRLYNATNKVVWEALSQGQRFNFNPTQYLAKHEIYSQPLAKTRFTVQPSVKGPSGWTVPPMAYPQQQGQQMYPQQMYPQQQGPRPQFPQMGQSPYPQMGQSPYPGSPMGFPQQRPPGFYPPFMQPPGGPKLQVPKSININGTFYYVLAPGRPKFSVVQVNSTLFTTDTYMKKLRMTPLLIIDNKPYVWRNKTHVPGRGPSVYLNGTHYVPSNIQGSMVHHHHYHDAAATFYPTATLQLIYLALPVLSSLLYRL